MRRIAEFKRDNASLLDNLLPDQEQDAFLNHKVVNVMKGRDHKGRRVLIVNVGGNYYLKRHVVNVRTYLLPTLITFSTIFSHKFVVTISFTILYLNGLLT